MWCLGRCAALCLLRTTQAAARVFCAHCRFARRVLHASGLEHTVLGGGDCLDPDLYEGEGGNNLALQLVIDALKLQPCEPTFVDGRDALLAADQIATGGVNNCAIWESFAKRGVGDGADDGGSASALDVSESFEVPVACPEPSGILLSVAVLATLAGLTRSREGPRAARKT